MPEEKVTVESPPPPRFPAPMTQEQAFQLAQYRFGDRGRVGIGALPGQQVATHHVGWKENGTWQWIGWGATFEDAFACVKKVKMHFRDKIEVYR